MSASSHSMLKHFMSPGHCDLASLATVYLSGSLRLLIEGPSVSSVTWNGQADVGREVSLSMRVQKLMGTLLSRAKHYLNWPDEVCCCPAGSSLSLFCSAHHWLAACHPDHSQEPSPHNHSSCWIIQSKQWPTFEVGNKLERRHGVE